MLKNGLVRSNDLLRVTHCCPVCKEEDHRWLKVYAENKAKLKKLEKVLISWCEQQNDYVPITKIDN